MADLNPQLTRTQFADFHRHGWVHRAVYKKDGEPRPALEIDCADCHGTADGAASLAVYRPQGIERSVLMP